MAKAQQQTSLKARYMKEVTPELQKDLKVSNVFALPKVTKVVVNVGVGKNLKDEKFINMVVEDITAITGQRPVQTKARQAIAGFKVREGNVVGVMVTLRGAKMYDFIERLTRVALPRVRDFRGISLKGFDGSGNYSLGLREHIVFPEVSTDAVERTFPLEITIVNTAKNKEEGLLLLKHLGFPFEKQ